MLLDIGMRVPEAIVLAGGHDARLNPLTNADQPKCLLPVANAPALSYSLTALQKAGITAVFVVRSLPPVLACSLEQRVRSTFVISTGAVPMGRP